MHEGTKTCDRCDGTLSRAGSAKPAIRDTNLIVVVGTSGINNLKLREGKPAQIVAELVMLGAALPTDVACTPREVALAVAQFTPSVASLCSWSPELNTVFHMPGLERVAKITFLSSLSGEDPESKKKRVGSDGSAEALGLVLESALGVEVEHVALLVGLTNNAIDDLHGHQQAFARQLRFAQVAAREEQRELVVVATGGLKIQAMICGAFSFALGAKTVYMHETFPHHVVELAAFRGIFQPPEDQTPSEIAMLRAGTVPFADVPRTATQNTSRAPTDSVAGTPAGFGRKIATLVWERGWAREVEGAQAAPDLGVPCAVEVDVRDDGDWLILRAPTFGLAVKPHPLAWEADPIGLQQELVGLVLSELG